ncbi:MAG: DUF697 domain-containing protein [Pseudanabaenaceae cyanobacterium bins.68]|nr:DUF697 domain-containing protein [Pseudanabaenaceae cyanobacterium bins.68]
MLIIQSLWHGDQILGVVVIGAIGLAIVTGLQQRRNSQSQPQPELPLQAQVMQDLQNTQHLIVKLDHLKIRQQLLERANQIADLLDQKSEPDCLQVAIAGSRGVGKTAVIQALLGNSSPSQANMLSLATRFRGGKRKIRLVELNLQQLSQAIKIELVVLLVKEQPDQAELEFFTELQQLHKPIIICLNQSDLYSAAQLSQILQDLQKLDPEAIAIAAQPKPITVRQYAPAALDQPTQVWQEQIKPNIQPLKHRLENFLADRWQQVYYQNLHSQVRSLHQAATQYLNQLRRQKAQPLIRQYQWLNASTTLINPLPTLDLCASSMLNALLLVDLAKLYDQDLSLEQAKQIAAIIGKNLWQLGCVELATSAIATALKFDLIGVAIGGTTQAVSAAFITKVGANTFLEYLETTSVFPLYPIASPTHSGSSLPIDLTTDLKEESSESLTTLSRLCQNNLAQSQGREVFDQLISNFKKLKLNPAN